ncbi:MAG: hypothetical protein IIZ39_03080 [Blautia sp.]|nr:hypothetical protein [Blautia sp.]
MQITSICLGTLPLPLITPFQTALRRTEAICDLEVDYNLCGYGGGPAYSCHHHVRSGRTLPQ